MDRGLQPGFDGIGKNIMTPVFGDIAIQALTLPDSPPEDNDIGVDEIDDMRERPRQTLFISGHGALGQRFPPLRGGDDLRPGSTFSPRPKIICGKPGT